MITNVLGLDLSLTATGICKLRITQVKAKDPVFSISVGTLKNDLRGHERLKWILGAATAAPQDLTLVAIEGPAYNQQGGQAGHHERAGLWWLVAHRLWNAGTPYAVVTPGGRAKYAAGRGTASKDEVLAAVIKRYGHLVDVHDNNQADALVLAAMAAHHLGYPIAMPPALNASVLSAIQWPALISDCDTE